MLRLASTPLLLTFAFICGALASSHPAHAAPRKPNPAMAPPPPPPTARTAAADTLFGVTVPDPYRWLEDVTQDPVKTWVDAQDAYARGHLDSVPGRDALAKRFEELFYVDYTSAPQRRGDRLFYTRRHKDKEKSVVYWKQGDAGAEQVLFDPNTWSDDGSVSLGGWYPSWDGRWVAYKVKENNADESTMKVMDVATGVDSAIDTIGGAKYAWASWTADHTGFYYTFLPSGPDIPVDQRPGYADIRYHALGTDPATDPVLFPATGSAQRFLGAGVTRDGRYLLLYVQQGWNATDVYVRDLHRGVVSAPVDPAMLPKLDVDQRVALQAQARGFEPLAVGLDANVSVDYWQGQFYVLTDHEAPRYRMFAVDAQKLSQADWRELVAERDGVIIESAGVYGGHLVLSLLENASSAVEVRSLDGALVRRVALPGIGTVGGFVGREDLDEAYFGFSSFTQPTEIHKMSIATGETERWFKVELPIDTSRFEVEQRWYPSKDGTQISMFVVQPKGLAMSGDHPTLLYGYGGFNVNLTPSYASSVAIWLEQGGIYAVANLRGGGEYGEAWHEAGMGANKQNVFDDFIAAAEALIEAGYTRPDKLAIRGGSNGGLLVGAAMTQRPDLFRAVICAVPLLDMVRYHLFGSGRTWIPEYGSAEDEAQFKTLHAYSPYHRVVAGTRYPAMLMMAADSDDRVDPMHARKFTAAVQHANAGPHPVMMRVERNAGHGGADLVKQSVASYTDQYAFLLWQLGMTGERP